MLKTHDRYDYSAISKRPDYSFPGGQRLAMANIDSGDRTVAEALQQGQQVDERLGQREVRGERLGPRKVLRGLIAAELEGPHNAWGRIETGMAADLDLPG